ncbi:hypothetical protein E3N88_10528 [Mikania micrantha]|uniref:Uncharacterized protein n=1 Tax=Mikania micrantha TaxID=192012 RepID=A0A5N6PD48_9ASTR|nr:hypothetical protein E3N88_10528 [Mikania micrantha]
MVEHTVLVSQCLPLGVLHSRDLKEQTVGLSGVQLSIKVTHKAILADVTVFTPNHRAFPLQIDPNSLKQASKPPGSIIEAIPCNLKCCWSPWSLEVEQGSYKRPSTTGTSSSVAIPTESCYLR